MLIDVQWFFTPIQGHLEFWAYRKHYGLSYITDNQWNKERRRKIIKSENITFLNSLRHTYNGYNTHKNTTKSSEN